MNFEIWFSSLHPEIPVRSALAVLELTQEGATVPFIARYRKEKTGNLDEVQIRAAVSAKETWDETIKRQAFIVGEIEKQGKLSPELKDKILQTFRLETLEDIYLPYKLKRKTKAMAAKEAGLEPLAQALWDWGHGAARAEAGQTAETLAAAYVNAEKNVKDAAGALAGAQDIVTERLAEMLPLREFVRGRLFDHGFVRAKKGEKAKTPSQYENYFEYAEPVKSLGDARNSHRYLALRRGWMEEELVISIGGAPDNENFEAELLEAFQRAACTEPASPAAALLGKAARMAFKVHVFPALETEVHKSLKDSADLAAINVFAENVANLLLSAPFGPKAVMGIDPGLRTGCKVAIVDASGKFAGHDLLHLHSEHEKKRAEQVVVKGIQTQNVRAVAVGNGTAGRETETWLRECLRANGLTAVPVVMVSESGASVYSASDVAREEFPDLDVTVRGAISIARRLQDPLAELVKVDPKSIGVGQYQHDVSPGALKKSLGEVVDSCVNKVGVNLNTASQHLLSRVSGIGPGLAKAIVEFRVDKGLFKSRDDLLQVPRFTKKTFEQAAGFLRIPEGVNPLDNTGVHPERYAMLESLAARLGKQLRDLVGEGVRTVRADSGFRKEAGEFTFNDIVSELEKPGRDPREEFVPFSFLDGVFEMKDLNPGMMCPGIVTNVTNFGAFVDIGVHQDGLVHISQLADQFVRDPREVVKPGDRVTVRVLEVRLDRKQISLSMRSSEGRSPGAFAGPRDERAPSGGGGAGGAGRGRSGPAQPGAGGGNYGAGGRNGGRVGGPGDGHGAGHGGGGRDRGGYGGGGGGGGYGGGRDRPSGGPSSFSSKPAASKPAALDPNNPFHKLAALKLGGTSSKK